MAFSDMLLSTDVLVFLTRNFDDDRLVCYHERIDSLQEIKDIENELMLHVSRSVSGSECSS
jgi:ribosome-binding ATPase YchF (GTP1/OBG family)